VQDYDLPAPFLARPLAPRILKLPLKQNAGTPCLPKVQTGDRIAAGQVIGEPALDALGAVLHAPRAGTVREVNDQQIILDTHE
jgi:Na+-translocating ferredoxin:NAD+ oxidoreductase RnfC subunit